MERIEDTYFSDSSKALEIAQQQNVFGPYENLQICYYDGKKIRSSYKNLIHLPKNKITETLLSSQGRLPTRFEINSEDADEIYTEIEKFKRTKNRLHYLLLKEIKEMTLDFNNPLRIYISADYGGKVVLKIYELLKNSFEENGYEVYYDLNNEITLMDDYRRAKAIHEFRPHITVNINRIRNEQLCDDMFNFIWFQDPTLVLYDKTKIYERKRDYFFYLVDNFKIALEEKNISSEKILKQSFASNNKSFFIDKNINKENKIVFIGNNYFELVNPTSDYKNETKMIEKLSTIFNENNLTKEKLEALSIKYFQNGLIKSKEHLEMFIFPAIVRIEVLKWICEQDGIQVEIYGKGWDGFLEFKSFYKGYLHSETEIMTVCNSAKYSLLAHPEYYYQQRLMEASACGSIAVVYEGVNNFEEFYHRDNVLLFNTRQSLYSCIGAEPVACPQAIAEDTSYKNFIDKMITIVKENI